jgi:hypothetical protein
MMYLCKSVNVSSDSLELYISIYMRDMVHIHFLVQVLVLDEADNLLDDGNREKLLNIGKYVLSHVPKR